MDAQIFIKLKTEQICQRLGAVEAQLVALQATKEQLIAELKYLDAMAPALKQLKQQPTLQKKDGDEQAK